MKNSIIPISSIALAGSASAITMDIGWSNSLFLDIPVGSLVQLGVFVNAPTGSSDPFAGDYLLLDSVQSGQTSSRDPGSFSGITILDTRLGTFPSSIQDGDVIAVRYFNGPTVESSTAFNTVTAPTWDALILPLPAVPLVAVNLTSTTPAVYEGGPSSALRTTIPIPEPSSALLLAFGCLSLLKRRR